MGIDKHTRIWQDVGSHGGGPWELTNRDISHQPAATNHRDLFSRASLRLTPVPGKVGGK